MAKVSNCLTIFEGPDGSGKTTTAKKYAALSGARYVHFSNLPNVGKNLARMYVEAMLPALLGHQHVVLDRCWLSELPYGITFRQGQDRLGDASRRMLERLAMRCATVVVRCRPPWEVARQNYLNRRKIEYLDNEEQLKSVYRLYDEFSTDLPELVYNYKTQPILDQLYYASSRTHPHPTDVQSAGNWCAKTVLVGERFADQKDCDPLYQWPFASFDKTGCSQWLTEQLGQHNINETELLWLNADQDLSVLYQLDSPRLIALGNVAHTKLSELGFKAEGVPHPQHHKRFNSKNNYELFNLIGEDDNGL